MPFYFLDLATLACSVCDAKPDAATLEAITEDNAGGILYQAGWRSDPTITCPACAGKKPEFNQTV